MQATGEQQYPTKWSLGPVSIWRPSFPGMGISMLKIRRSRDRLIFNMGIPILVRLHLFIGTSPRLLEDFLNYVFFYSTIGRRNSKSLHLEWTLQLPILYIKYILRNVRCLFCFVLFKWSHYGLLVCFLICLFRNGTKYVFSVQYWW